MTKKHKYKKLSIIIPTYNEETTILEIIKRVLKSNTLGLTKEIIIVDDKSTDNTKKILKNIKKRNIKILFHKSNQGKGSAIKTAIKHSTGDIILIQDADLEYNPEEYTKLLRPILNRKTYVVYGSRELSGKNTHSSELFHLGGQLVTKFTNILYKSSLTDEATGYKVFDSKTLKDIPLRCRGFEFCPEVTAKILKRNIEITEIPITYTPRHISEGKKIRPHHGLEALWTLLQVKLGLLK